MIKVQSVKVDADGDNGQVTVFTTESNALTFRGDVHVETSFTSNGALRVQVDVIPGDRWHRSISPNQRVR